MTIKLCTLNRGYSRGYRYGSKALDGSAVPCSESFIRCAAKVWRAPCFDENPKPPQVPKLRGPHPWVPHKVPSKDAAVLKVA